MATGEQQEEQDFKIAIANDVRSPVLPGPIYDRHSASVFTRPFHRPVLTSMSHSYLGRGMDCPHEDCMTG